MLKINNDINPKDYFPDSKFIIVYAFTLEKDGKEIHYFKFDDPFNIPAQRALSTVKYYREVDQKITSDLLRESLTAINNYLTPTTADPRFELGKAQQILNILLYRLDLPPDTDLIYSLAAVVYFDQFENPLIYEYNYAQTKIKSWQNGGSTPLDFFSLLPIRTLVPYLEHAGENLQAFDDLAKSVKQEHIALTLQAQYRKPLTKTKV
jgi:hypothetical protein